MVVVTLTKNGDNPPESILIFFLASFVTFMIYHEMFGNYCVSQDYRVIPVISVFDWFHATLETQKNTGPQGSLKFSGTKKSEPHRNSRRFWMRVVFSPAPLHGMADDEAKFCG